MRMQALSSKTFGFLATAATVVGLLGCESSGDSVDGAEPVDSTEANAALVVSAYEKVLNQRDTKALEAMFAEDYIQHNPQVADGREGLANFVGYLNTRPEATSQIKRVIAQGDLVALHVHVTETAAQRGNEFAGTAIVDIFRVANGKIVEHWDVIQPVPETSANGHSMFDGAGLYQNGTSASEVSAEESAALVVSAYEKVLNQRDTKALEALFAEDYTQHNPQVADGREGLANFVGYLNTLPDATSKIKRVIAQGDLVALHVHVTETAAQRGNEFAGTAIVDIFRVANGKIVEHWDVIQPVPETSANGHSMFDGGGLYQGATE